MYKARTARQWATVCAHLGLAAYLNTLIDDYVSLGKILYIAFVHSALEDGTPFTAGEAPAAMRLNFLFSEHV